jgi:hypothetical protein
VAVTCALAFDVGGPRFETHDVILLQLNSAASSIVMMRSSLGMKLDSVFSSVVLPQPVPPQMMMLSRALIAPSSSITISGRERLVVEQVFQLERVRTEATNGNRRSIEGERRNNGIHT